MKKLTALLLILSLMLIFAACGLEDLLAYQDSRGGRAAYELTDLTALTGISVHFIDVGQGDSILVVADGEAMLIDAGTRGSGKTVSQYLMDLDLLRLKYVIASHPHEDHIGGLSQVFADFVVENLLFSSAGTDTQTYKKLVELVESMEISVQYPVHGMQFSLGGSTVRVVGPIAPSDDVNESSLVLRLDYGGVSFLFTGDAGRESELDMLDAGTLSEVDVLKVGHHGSETSTSYVFLREIMPRYTVISCGANNQYGHPHDDVLSRLRDCGSEIYRTDLQGSIVFESDGESIRVTIEKG